jgi:hypothetical protein
MPCEGLGLVLSPGSELRVSPDAVLQVVEGLRVPDEVDVLDVRGDQEVPDAVLEGEAVGELLLEDAVVEGVELELVPLGLQGLVDALVVCDPLFEAVDGLALGKVGELGNVHLVADVGVEYLVVVVEALDEEHLVLGQGAEEQKATVDLPLAGSPIITM